MKERIYKKNIVGILHELADKSYQKRVWRNADSKPGMTISYTEAMCMLFDDCVVGDLLDKGEVIFDTATSEAFEALNIAVGAVEDDRAPEEIINDPLMQIVREKAAIVLKLIETSTGKESTVEIVE